jgi:hypothetical protein
MELKPHISLANIEKAVTKVGSAANIVFKDIDRGIEHDESLVEFHERVKAEETTSVQSVAETVVYAAFREVFDPIHAAMKALTGETVHGHSVGVGDRIKSAAEAATTMTKMPKAAKTALKIGKLGAAIYRNKKQ